MHDRDFIALTWFRRLIGVGLVANLIFALPGLFAPRFLEHLLGVGATNTPYWLRDASLLLLIISLMYVPVIRDPFRYLFVTYLAVAGRFAAGLLFLFGLLYIDFPDGVGLLSAVDLTLSTLQALALFFMLRAGDPRSGQHAARKQPIRE